MAYFTVIFGHSPQGTEESLENTSEKLILAWIEPNTFAMRFWRFTAVSSPGYMQLLISVIHIAQLSADCTSICWRAEKNAAVICIKLNLQTFTDPSVEHFL
jgi:hypothetical protein